MNKIEKRLDEVLASGSYENDVARACKISTELGMLVFDEMDDIQKSGLVTAKRFWANEVEDQVRIAALDKMWDKSDAFQEAGEAKSRKAAINHFVVCSLVTNDGLSFEYGELMVELAEQTGLSEAAIEEVFKNCIPDY